MMVRSSWRWSAAVLYAAVGCSSDDPEVQEPRAGARSFGSASGAPTVSGGNDGLGGGGVAAAGAGNATSGGTGGAGGTASGMAGAPGMGGAPGAAGAGAAGAGGTGGASAEPPCPTNEIARCSNSSPITCNFAGASGDFLVTLDLGGPSASSAYVEAEAHRRMLANVTLAAGETARFSFAVNVRQPEGQPIQDVPPGTPGLQLTIRGDAPQLSAICVRPHTPAPKLWIAGDSTVCDQADTAYAGWGQHLPQYFAPPVVVANYADSGESSTSVLASAKLWGAIKAGWKAGDWVLVQLGHNDKSVTPGTFRENITAFVTQAKAAGVHIILCTPIARVGTGLEQQHQSSAGADIPRIIKEVGQAEQVPVIDLTALTYDWLQTVDWKQYFALGTDRTHPNPAGAAVVAGLVRDALAEGGSPLAKHLR